MKEASTNVGAPGSRSEPGHRAKCDPTAKGRHSERSEESPHTSPRYEIWNLPSTNPNQLREREAPTRKARHPERNEVKPKDLHSSQPTPTSQKPKPRQQPNLASREASRTVRSTRKGRASALP